MLRASCNHDYTWLFPSILEGSCVCLFCKELGRTASLVSVLQDQVDEVGQGGTADACVLLRKRKPSPWTFAESLHGAAGQWSMAPDWRLVIHTRIALLHGRTERETENKAVHILRYVSSLWFSYTNDDLFSGANVTSWGLAQQYGSCLVLTEKSLSCSC